MCAGFPGNGEGQCVPARGGSGCGGSPRGTVPGDSSRRPSQRSWHHVGTRSASGIIRELTGHEGPAHAGCGRSDAEDGSGGSKPVFKTRCEQRSR